MSHGTNVRIGRRRSTLPTVTAAALGVGLAIGIVASRTATAGSGAASAEYLPSVSDLMIATIQPRHERLWQAGQDKNWEFASYELGNLRGAFNRLGLAHPTVHDIMFPGMIASVMAQPLDELNGAIRSKDGTAFVKAYGDLTSACNSCHQALNHGAVEIKVPSNTSASDLDTNLRSKN
jgi:hypothetical protein